MYKKKFSIKVNKKLTYYELNCDFQREIKKRTILSAYVSKCPEVGTVILAEHINPATVPYRAQLWHICLHIRKFTQEETETG